MKYKFEIKEIDRFDRALNILLKKVPNGLLKAFKMVMLDLIARVKKLTPVGQYPKGSGRAGGNLRRKWALGEIVSRETLIEGEIINNAEYALPVEEGHKTKSGGFVQGRFMLKKAMMESEKEIVNTFEKIVQKICDKELR